MSEKFKWKEEHGDETIIRTHTWSPPGCHPVGCGLQLHVKDGRIDFTYSGTVTFGQTSYVIKYGKVESQGTMK